MIRDFEAEASTVERDTKVIARASTGLASQGPSGTLRNSENQDYAFFSPSSAVPCYNNRPYDELYTRSLFFELSIRCNSSALISANGNKIVGKDLVKLVLGAASFERLAKLKKIYRVVIKKRK